MSELTIYPRPGSYNDFCELNPDIDELRTKLHHMAQQMSLWKATSPEVNTDEIRGARFSPAERAHRALVEQARNTGATLVELATWPRVGEYDVPEDLVLPEFNELAA